MGKFQSKANLEDSKKLLEELQSKYELLQKSLEEEKVQENLLSEKIESLEFKISNSQERFKLEKNKMNKLRNNYEKKIKSRSWKITLPIRMVKDLYRNLFKSQPNNYKRNTTKADTYQHVKNGYYEDVRNLDKKLWGGFSTYALEELYKIKESNSAPVNEKVKAARAIVRYDYDNGDYEKALEGIQFINETKMYRKPHTDRIIPEIKVLKKVGQTARAKEIIWDTIDSVGLESELCISMAYIHDDPQEKLKWYNIIYEKFGFATVDRKDPARPISIENLWNPNAEASYDTELEKYKVSVIIPAYNAADSMHIALDSLLAQTHKNLEIIIVDDCSPDNTEEVVSKYIEKDPRIKYVKKEVNEGAYAARNTALNYVTGDYITIHDGDDWSHFQKIEVQLKAILKNPGSVGSVSYLIRAYEDISPVNAGSLLSIKFLMMNSSSLLLDKKVFAELGGWDSVRVAGDTEFLWRIEKVYGKDSIIKVEPKVPLSFALSNPNSLTGMSATNVKTIMYGLRKTYRESFQWWHDTVENKAEFHLDPIKRERKFPCPVPNMLKRPENRDYDIVFISDFTVSVKDQKLYSPIQEAVQAGKKIGFFHYPYYLGNPSEPLANDVYELASEHHIDLLVKNEEVNTKIAIVNCSYVLDYALDSAPIINAETAYVLKEDRNQSPEHSNIKEENLRKVFGMETNWITFHDLENVLLPQKELERV